MEPTIRMRTARPATCRQCGASFQVEERVMIGEVLECGACRAPLEVASIDPLVLEPFARIEAEEEDFEGFHDV